MGFFDTVLRRETKDLSGYTNTISLLTERMAELEMALEDVNWTRFTGENTTEFSRDGLRKINQLARLYYLKNPLVRRGVSVQAHYVFGQGVEIKSKDEDVEGVIQSFWNDARNRVNFSNMQALIEREIDLQLYGNIFFVFFTGVDGRVVVRTLPVDEIDDIITNPNDKKEVWYYRRSWMSGNERMERMYPDFRYRPQQTQDRYENVWIEWESPVYHIKTGGLSEMRFGVSEVYASIDWAKAYKEFLEDWSTLSRALSRIAYKVSTQGGKNAIAAARAKMASTLGLSSTEHNPAPVTGASFVAGTGSDITAVNTSGARYSSEDGRRLMLMVASAFGLPESFFGDVSVGTLATAKSLDRPTELKMRARQMFWQDTLENILFFVVEKAIRANGMPGSVTDEVDGTPKIVQQDGNPVSVTINFPPILEHDVNASVGAIVQAATLGASGTLAGTISQEELTRMLYRALGEPMPDLPAVAQAQSESMMIEAVKELKRALNNLAS